MEIYSNVVGLHNIMEVGENNGKNPCIQFAEGVLSGDSKKDETFVGFMEATMILKDKKAYGVGHQNFKFPPIIAELAQICP